MVGTLRKDSSNCQIRSVRSESDGGAGIRMRETDRAGQTLLGLVESSNVWVLPRQTALGSCDGSGEGVKGRKNTGNSRKETVVVIDAAKVTLEAHLC